MVVPEQIQKAMEDPAVAGMVTTFLSLAEQCAGMLPDIPEENKDEFILEATKAALLLGLTEASVAMYQGVMQGFGATFLIANLAVRGKMMAGGLGDV